MNPRQITIFTTRDLKLATILDRLGFDFESDTIATRIKRESGEESTVFHFNSVHPETGQQAEEILRVFIKTKQVIDQITEAVTGKTLEEAKPISRRLWNAHLAAYSGSLVPEFTALLFNRDALLTVIKSIPRQVVFQRNGKTISLPENASHEDKARLAKFI